jgi:hypothetical protein
MVHSRDTLDLNRRASLKRLPLRRWTNRCAGACALRKTWLGPVPAEYSRANRARRFEPSSLVKSVTFPTTASGWWVDIAAVIHSGVTSSQRLGIRDERKALIIFSPWMSEPCPMCAQRSCSPSNVRRASVAAGDKGLLAIGP